MLNDEAIQLMNQSLWLVLTLSAPPIAAAMVVALIVALFQAATQVQEQTTQYAVKFIAVAFTLALSGRGIGSSLLTFGDRIFSNFAMLVQP